MTKIVAFNPTLVWFLRGSGHSNSQQSKSTFNPTLVWFLHKFIAYDNMDVLNKIFQSYISLVLAPIPIGLLLFYIWFQTFNPTLVWFLHVWLAYEDGNDYIVVLSILH